MSMVTSNDLSRTQEHPQNPSVDGTGNDIDLERVVFDPEYRARARDALNRTSSGPQSDPGKGS